MMCVPLECTLIVPPLKTVEWRDGEIFIKKLNNQKRYSSFAMLFLSLLSKWSSSVSVQSKTDLLNVQLRVMYMLGLLISVRVCFDASQSYSILSK